MENKKFELKTQFLYSYKLKFNFKGNSESLEYLNGKEIKKVEIGKCGEECVYTIDEENKLLSFYGSGTLLSIDSTLTEQQRNQITNITISSSITMIGDNLFDSFINLALSVRSLLFLLTEVVDKSVSVSLVRYTVAPLATNRLCIFFDITRFISFSYIFL